MRYLNLTGQFLKASFQEEAAYRANFYTSLLSSVVNLATGVAGSVVLFGQVETSRLDPAPPRWRCWAFISRWEPCAGW
jgi:ABC-type uncharacterized transport system permease subunit